MSTKAVQETKEVRMVIGDFSYDVTAFKGLFFPFSYCLFDAFELCG